MIVNSERKIEKPSAIQYIWSCPSGLPRLKCGVKWVSLQEKRMAKKYRIHLKPEERNCLEEVIAKRDSKSRQVKRAYALLAADENGHKRWPDEQIMQAYGLSIASLERLRQRLVVEDLQTALNGKKREVFKEKVFTGEVEAKLIALRCSDCPEGYNRWTLQLLADQMVSLGYVEHMSHESVRGILKKTNLSPGKSRVG
jgi:hypothetical protein